MAFFMGHLRNLLLNQVDTSGKLVGHYALALLFFQMVAITVNFGGNTVASNFLPKIKEREDKSRFISGYGVLQITILTALMLILGLREDWFVTLAGEESAEAHGLFLLLAPFVVFSTFFQSVLAGLFKYRVSSMLQHIQVFLVTAVALGGWLFLPQVFARHAWPILIGTIGIAYVMGVFGSVIIISRSIGFRLGMHFPPGFWKLSMITHLQTLLTFAYLNLDRIFIVAYIDLAELGIYFIFIQLGMLVTFLSMKTGHVLLSSFGDMISRRDYSAVQTTFRKLCRYCLIASTVISLGLILFSQSIASIFGPVAAEKNLWLILIAVMFNMNSLGNVAANILLVQQKGLPFISCALVTVGVQLTIMLTLIQDWGIYGVLLGRGAAIVVGQLMLFYFLAYKLTGVSLRVGTDYLWSQLFVLAAGLLTVWFSFKGLLYPLVLYVVLLLFFVRLIRLSRYELLALVPRSLKSRFGLI